MVPEISKIIPCEEFAKRKFPITKFQKKILGKSFQRILENAMKK